MLYQNGVSFAASVNQVGSSSVAQEQPLLSKDDKQTIVMFCRAALSNPLSVSPRSDSSAGLWSRLLSWMVFQREKIKDPLELRRICGTLIREFKRQRDFEAERTASF